MSGDRNVYGASTEAQPKIRLRALLNVPWVGFRGIVWRWRVLAFVALNVVAIAPMAWFEQDDLPLPAMAGMLAAFPVLAYLQPWTGVLSLLKAMRTLQIVMLPLLVLFGLLNLPIAIAGSTNAPDWPRAAAGIAGVVAAIASLRGQIRLWRWQATRLADRTQSRAT